MLSLYFLFGGQQSGQKGPTTAACNGQSRMSAEDGGIPVPAQNNGREPEGSGGFGGWHNAAVAFPCRFGSTNRADPYVLKSEMYDRVKACPLKMIRSCTFDFM